MSSENDIPRDASAAVRELEGRLQRTRCELLELRRIKRWGRLAPELAEPRPDVRIARLQAPAPGQVVACHAEFTAGITAWRTSRPMRLWPVVLENIDLLWKAPASLAGLEARLAPVFLRLVLATHAPAPAFAKLEGFDDLTIWFDPNNRRADLVFDALALHRTGAFGIDADGVALPVGLEFAGLADDEVLFHLPGLPPAAGLLTEWALFPAKFAGFKITGLGRLAAAADRRIDLIVPLGDAAHLVESARACDFATDHVPVVNLVRREISPFSWTALDPEAVIAHPTMQIHSIESVRELSPRNEPQPREIGKSGLDGVRWESWGVPRPRRDRDVVLTRRDPAEGPDSPAARLVCVRALASDGAAAALVPSGAALTADEGPVRGTLVGGPSGPHVPCLSGDPPPLNVQPGSLWTETLRARCYFDSEVPLAIADVEAARRRLVARALAAVNLIETRTVSLKLALRQGEPAGPCVGTKHILALDETAFPGGFARFVLMLDRYLGAMTRSGEFTRLVFKTSGGLVYRCPPRLGIRTDL